MVELELGLYLGWCHVPPYVTSLVTGDDGTLAQCGEMLIPNYVVIFS